MKKTSLFFALAAMAFVACAEKEYLGGGETPETPGVERTTLFAVMEDVQTKASVDINGKTGWASGDQVAVYTSAEKFETLTLETMVDGVAKFTGSIEGTFNSGDLAIYPAAAAKAYAADKIIVTYPDTYAYSAGCLNTPMIAKVAKAEDEPVSFSHLGGAMSMTFSNVPEWAVKFVFESADKAVTGDYEVVGMEPGDATVSAVSGTTNNKVSFTFAKSTKDMTFVVPLPLGTYNKFSVWFENEEGKEISGSKITVDTESEINKVERKAMVAMPDQAYEPWFTVNWVFGDADVAIPQFKSHVPAIDNAGNVYVLSQDTKMYKVSPAGEKVWDFTLSKWVGGDLRYMCNSPVLRRDGTVAYAVGGNGGNAALYGIVTSSGEQKFETTQSEFYDGWVRMWQGRVVVGLKNKVFVHAGGSRAIHCFDEETGKRISYISKDLTGDQLGTSAGDGTALSLDGAIAIATGGAMYGADATKMEEPTEDYRSDKYGYFRPFGFKMQHKGWEFKDHDAMAVIKYGDKTYFARVGGDSNGYKPRPHFTSTDKALTNPAAPIVKASGTDYFQNLGASCFQDEGGVIAGENGEAIFTLKKGDGVPAGIWAVIPSETYEDTEIAKYYSYATLNDVSGSCAIDNNGYIHIIDDNAIYYIVDPDPETQTCSLIARADVFELIKSAGKLPDETLGYARTWTSVKLGSDGKIYLNLNMQKGTSFMFGSTVCMSFKGTTSPSLVSSWPQEQADPMNSGLQVR